MKYLSIIITCLLFTVSCNSNKSEKSQSEKSQSEKSQSEKSQSEKSQSEKSQSEKLQSEKLQSDYDRANKIEQIVNFFNTADSTARSAKDDVITATNFKYNKGDETLSYYTIKYSSVTCMLTFYKIYLRHAKPELETIFSDYTKLTYLNVYSSKCKIASKLFVTKNYESVSNEKDYVDFMNSEPNEAENSRGIQFLLTDDMVPRYKKAFADLLELHGVKQLAY
jgi:hypothetical protein